MSADSVCAGCGKLPGPGLRQRQHEVEIGHSTKVWLCEGRLTIPRTLRTPTYYASASVSATCLRAARQRLAVCPGCGEEGWEPGTICGACFAAIERDREAGGQKLGRYVLCTSYLLGVYIGGFERQDKIREAARTLARAVGRVVRSRDYEAKHIGGHAGDALAADPCVEMTERQAEALEKFSALMREVSAAWYDAGKEEGRSLLLGLARGDIRIADYEERVERRKGAKR